MALSYIDKLFNQFIWKEKEFTKFAMAQPGQAQTKGLEILIMNYGK